MTKSEIRNLGERVNRIVESKPTRSEVDVVADFINELPSELRNQINAYTRERIKQLEKEEADRAHGIEVKSDG